MLDGGPKSEVVDDCRGGIVMAKKKPQPAKRKTKGTKAKSGKKTAAPKKTAKKTAKKEVKKTSPAKARKAAAPTRKKQPAAAKKPVKSSMVDDETTKQAVSKPAKSEVEPKQLDLDEDEITEEIDEDMSDEIEEDMEEELALDDEDDDDVDYLEKSEDLLDEGDDYRTH